MSEEKRILLKLGGKKHLGEMRWRDALTLFDEIYSVCCYKEISYKWEIPSDNEYTIGIPHNFINQKLFGVLLRTKRKKWLNLVSALILVLFRVFNYQAIKTLKSIKPTSVLCSYGDYDYSDFACLVFGKYINAPIIRAYKETRPDYNYTEYAALKRADKVVLYDVELKRFLERKYGQEFFTGKEVILGYDENALPACILDNIKHRQKISSGDNRVHLAILSYRVDSTPTRQRDQGRYYYVDTIKQLLDARIVVHLHCAQFNDDNGVNQYQLLVERYPEQFFIERPLEMKHSSSEEEWIESCEILSQYDVGLLHNITDNSTVSEFDRINIPHRFFAYEAAHVIPVLQRGNNLVLERYFIEKKCGFVYDQLEDIEKVLMQDFDYYTPSYKEYLQAIFML